MRRLRQLLLCLGLMGLANQLEAADSKPVLSWHFAGIKSVLETNPDSVWREVSQIKPSVVFKNQVKARVAEWLPLQLGWEDHNWVGTTPFVRSLLDGVFDNESILHLEGDDLAGASWAFAIRLSEEEMNSWMSRLFRGGRQFGFKEPRGITVAGAKGWELISTDGRQMFSFLSKGNWLIIADDVSRNAIASKWAGELSAGDRPQSELKNGWLTLTVFPAIMGWDLDLPVIGEVESVDVEFSWQGRYVRTLAEVRSAGDLDLRLDDWATPKEIVFDPLVSFTALRGAKDWVSQFAAAKGLPDDLRPNQLFNWTRGDVVLMSEFAAPVADAQKAFALLQKSVSESYGRAIMDRSLGEWIQATDIDRSMWRGLPVFVPYFGPDTSGGKEYIKGGIFPLQNRGEQNPAPSALFDQFENREKLFYYDWEITAARINAFKQAERFVDLVFPPKPKQESTNGVEWMGLIFSKLENTITEATLEGDRNVRVVRKSPIGLSGIELWLLVHWMDGKEFPAFPYGTRPNRSDARGAQVEKPLPRARPVDH